jgi:UDP-glucose 4-epimerase
MNILVTGGAGFIGKHLVRSLLEKGNAVTIFDNFSNSTKESVSSLVEMGVKIIEGDITKLPNLLNAIKNHEIVIHLAAKISVSDSINNPTETFRVNVDGTRNVLTACKKNHVKKLIVSSSAAVYGESNPNVKLTEESKTNPISPYGESKVRMENQIRGFESKNKINCIILRFFNIYGIGQSSEYAGVITKFIKKIIENKPLEIFGNGQQTRDFVGIDDVIDSIHNAISYEKSGTFNIASGKTITIEELAKQMILLSGKNLEIKKLIEKKGDIKHSKSEIFLAKKRLGYNPKIDLRLGIEKFLSSINLNK